MMQCGTYWSGCSQSPQRRETREDKMKERSHGTPYFQDTTANLQVMQLSVAAGSGSAAAADELAFRRETTSQSRLRATCNGVSWSSQSRTVVSAPFSQSRATTPER